MKKRSLWWSLGAVAGVAVLVAGAYFGSPYWTVHQIRKAAQARDVDALMARVDQPALQRSVRLAMGFRLAEVLSGGARADSRPRLAEGATAIASAQAEPLVSLLSSPTLLFSMLIEGYPSQALTGQVSLPAAWQTAAQGGKAAGDWDARLNRVDASTIVLESRQSPGRGGFILRRSGWLKWKLSGLQLPRN